MNDSDRITVSFPKGIKRKDLAIIAIFGIVMATLYAVLQNVIASSSQNPNFALTVIVLVLLVICFLFVYASRTISKEGKNNDKIVSDLRSE